MLSVDPQVIFPGYVVFARPDGDHGGCGVGPFVGVVQDVLVVDGVHYVHVRGGLAHVDELFVPLSAVRFVGGRQVHLQLAVEDLLGQTWHLPPGERALQPVGFWG